MGCGEPFHGPVGEHFLIVADGQADFSTAERLRALAANRTLIALDGAANFLWRIGIVPNVAIGDFDSLGREARKFLEGQKTEFLPDVGQDTTDLEKALIYLGGKDCASAAVVHGLGGRPDHALGNVTFLKKYAKLVRGLSLVTDRGQIRYWEDVDVVLEAAAGAHCGFFGFPLARVTAIGLRYGMGDYHLELGVSESVANSFLGGGARLSVVGQCLAALDRSVRLVADGEIGNEASSSQKRY
ncbi:MAG: thiamine diphosphokinase [Puniceicoccales bacterium]|nr:thiamine diphosphokinase [Puniceicoccales bacterium]